ncbi:putative HTH-type transcriptional regulator YjiR [Variibacter gotjawalensis]|uniref:Putative HTH-type transcriptional regulator YjiR n=1 Tax=Variibacter gotjawalensis TaxID=1333996 RepID=A0A0S3Q0Y9_9BRAD|nr:PLP-dependent aminotransferase family protein [Variibacter gotjawalensis]NIK47635.1 DNA-binding transcriptional MocR family regulator [Variibacter gotjawalensis]RZS49532.1 GntR family transcriptional regulator [Variibacter gotjawalensis]BAT61795.1 putative HTH-type transcriptional regulator YjiR [Variibacter gotjawalensis]
MEWTPTIRDREGPLYSRIVDALRSDIESGRLHRGEQLPTHRALALALDVDLTTVTRAYREARDEGLTEARVGQGTFVAESLAQSPRRLASGVATDLSMNLPPQPLEADLEGRITRGLAALRREFGFSSYLNYRDAGGSADERDAAASWLRARVPQAEAERLVIFPGTQAALFCFLSAKLVPGDIVFTECLTYPGLMAAADVARVKLVGLPIDAEGLVPEALADACKRQRAKALYLVPTIHSPTTATMSAARREAIVEIARANDLVVFEDDAYGALAPDVTPIAALAPERTYLAASLAKCVAPGLRVSFLLTPTREEAARFSTALRAMVQMPVSLTLALATRWVRDGSLDEIITAIRNEATARQSLAARALRGHVYRAHPNGHHIWVPLPKHWSRIEFAGHIQRQGVGVVTSEAFAVGDAAPEHAIRVALGAAASRAELVRALEVLAGALVSSAASQRIV